MIRIPCLTAFCIALSTAAFAQQDLTTIGQIEAEFDGETLSQTTVSYVDEGERLGTASLTRFGGLTSLSIYGSEARQLSIEAMYTIATPDPSTAPLDMTISYFPSGITQFWTSEEAPQPARVTFDRLDLTSDAPHASGSFEAMLCQVSGLGQEADLGTCLPIKGRFDTALILE
jgi:hypothetical protein